MTTKSAPVDLLPDWLFYAISYLGTPKTMFHYLLDHGIHLVRLLEDSSETHTVLSVDQYAMSLTLFCQNPEITFYDRYYGIETIWIGRAPAANSTLFREHWPKHFAYGTPAHEVLNTISRHTDDFIESDTHIGFSLPLDNERSIGMHLQLNNHRLNAMACVRISDWQRCSPLPPWPKP